MSSQNHSPVYPWEKTYPSTVNWNAPLPSETLTVMFDRLVGEYAHRPCLDFLGQKMTYKEVGEKVDHLAKGLLNAGFKKGSRIGLFLPNCPIYVIAYFAILKIGGTVVNLNPLYAEREIVHLLTDGGVDTLITLDLKALYTKLEGLRSKTPLRRIIVASMARLLPFPKNILFRLFKAKEIATWTQDDNHICFEKLLHNDGAYEAPSIDINNDIAVLQYTGGTTGSPKGAMLTHANLRANTEQAALCYPAARLGQEKILCVIPFFHVFAMTAAMNFGLRLGAELILLPRFELDALVKTIHHKKPTLLPAVPTIYTAINSYRRIDRYDLRSIRFCISGGAPLPVEVKHAFEKKTGCKLVEGYGLTEASPVVCCNPVDGVNKAGSIGLPLPRTIVEIRHLDDPRRVVLRGERGEVCVKGPQVMKGYWNKPAETENAFSNGFLRTGDVGYLDDDGYVYIVDRIKDMILCSGYNVYPRNVEEAIYLHPSVAECVVIGIPDPYRGQSVKAFVKLHSGQALTSDDLKSFLKDKLSPMEMPKQIEFRATLPKTLIGKLDRKALRTEEGLS